MTSCNIWLIYYAFKVLNNEEHTKIENCYIGHQMLTNLAFFILTFLNFLNLWFQPENSRFDVRDAAQERLDMRGDCHAGKILPAGVRRTNSV